MLSDTMVIHKPERRSKKEIAAQMRLEARSHANTCEGMAQALRLTGAVPGAAAALEQAAKFLRHFTQEDR